MTKLTIRKPKDLEFNAGEYVYLNIPSVAKYEWHPFTISSAPEEEGKEENNVQEIEQRLKMRCFVLDVFMVHIRAVGGWTEKVYELFRPRSMIEERSPSAFKFSEREKKLSMRGMLNLGFESANEDWKHMGSRYMENLKEFNRRVSSLHRVFL